jgi:tetratricopeptide (TPR) repeat protein
MPPPDAEAGPQKPAPAGTESPLPETSPAEPLPPWPPVPGAAAPAEPIDGTSPPPWPPAPEVVPPAGFGPATPPPAWAPAPGAMPPPGAYYGAPPPAWPFVPEPPPPVGPARWPVAVALLNFTGLGLGYQYLARRRRFVVCLILAAGLVTTAFATDAAGRPWLWRGIAAGWLVLLALDGWRLARRHPGALTAPRRRPTLVAVAAIAALAGGCALYGVVGNQVLESGQSAQADGDCKTATARFDLVTGPFELTLSPAVASAARDREYCRQFLTAVAKHDRGEFEAAVTGLREFLARTPSNRLDKPAEDRIQLAYLDWARSARDAHDYPKAIAVYRRLLQEYDAGSTVRQARGELAQTFMDEAQAQRDKFDPAGGSLLESSVRKAMSDYLEVQANFGNTDAAKAVPKAIEETFTAAVKPFTDGKYCEAIPTLEYLAELPGRAGDIVTTAKQDHAKAAFECGLLRYANGAYDEAADHFNTVVTKYNDNALTPAAGSAYIAATIASHKPGLTPPLPPPLAGDRPGNISLTFSNDSSLPVEVLLLGPTAHRIVIPGCTRCPEVYEDASKACVRSTGLPSVELGLRPGDYLIMQWDVDTGANPSDVTTIPVHGAGGYCLYRSRTKP